MKSKIMYQPSYSLVEIALDKDEKVVAETGAMVSMSANIGVETNMQSGGLFGALKRTILGGESFFCEYFYCTRWPRKDNFCTSFIRRCFWFKN